MRSATPQRARGDAAGTSADATGSRPGAVRAAPLLSVTLVSSDATP